MISFELGSSLDWTSMMKAEVTAETRPAYSTQTTVVRLRTQVKRAEKTDEDEGGVEVFVILSGVVLVKLVGVLAIDGEEVGA